MKKKKYLKTGFFSNLMKKTTKRKNSSNNTNPRIYANPKEGKHKETTPT